MDLVGGLAENWEDDLAVGWSPGGLQSQCEVRFASGESTFRCRWGICSHGSNQKQFSRTGNIAARTASWKWLEEQKQRSAHPGFFLRLENTLKELGQNANYPESCRNGGYRGRWWDSPACASREHPCKWLNSCAVEVYPNYGPWKRSFRKATKARVQGPRRCQRWACLCLRSSDLMTRWPNDTYKPPRSANVCKLQGISKQKKYILQVGTNTALAHWQRSASIRKAWCMPPSPRTRSLAIQCRSTLCTWRLFAGGRGSATAVGWNNAESMCWEKWVGRFRSHFSLSKDKMIGFRYFVDMSRCSKDLWRRI